MATTNHKPVNVFGATLSRRQFVKAGGALVVGFGIVGTDIWKNPARAAAERNSLDPALPASWIEIHPDNTILIRTGKSDFGQGSAFTAYPRSSRRSSGPRSRRSPPSSWATPIGRRMAAARSTFWDA